MSAQTDPFAAVRIRQSPQNIPEKEIQNPQSNQEDPFASVRIKKAEGFPFIPETGRHATRIGSRIAETIGGIPGDIGQLIQSGVFAGLEKLTGISTPEKAREQAKGFRAPSTSELRETSKSLSKGYTEPQNDIERIGDEYVSAVASLFGPMKFRRALGIGLAGQAAKEGLGVLGTSEGSQEAAKIGTMFLASLYNPKGALNYANQMYDKANAIAKGASISAPKLESNLLQLQSNLKKGISTPGKDAILKPVKELYDKISRGKILVEDLTATKRDLHSLMKDPALLTREKKLLKLLGRYVDNAIKPFEKIRPDFSKAYRPANEIYGAVMEGTKASDFIKRTLGAKSVLGTVLGEAILGHPEYIVPTAAAAVGAHGGARVVDFFTKLGKSKELQKFYGKAATAAAKEDAGALRMYSDTIDKIVK